MILLEVLWIAAITTIIWQNPEIVFGFEADTIIRTYKPIGVKR